jgi:hypothetical protein
MTLVRKKPRPGFNPSSQNSPLNSSPFLHQLAPTHHRAAYKSSRSPADNSLGAYFRTSLSERLYILLGQIGAAIDE